MTTVPHSLTPYPPLVRIGLIHYQFETIHPFIDGNGRIGRLLISLLLVYWNLMPLPLLYLSAFFERHRDKYCSLLFAVSARGAWRDWLLFFLQGIAEQSRDASMRAKQLQDLHSDWRQQLQQAHASGLLYGIVDWLFEQPLLAARDIQERFGVVHNTANQALRRLEELGVVHEATGRERKRLYLATPIIEIVE